MLVMCFLNKGMELRFENYLYMSLVVFCCTCVLCHVVFAEALNIATLYRPPPNPLSLPFTFTTVL